MANNDFVVNAAPKLDDGVHRDNLEIQYPDGTSKLYRFKVANDFSFEDQEISQTYLDKASDPNVTDEEWRDKSFEFVRCVLYDPIDDADLKKLSFDNWQSLVNHLASRYA